MVHALTDDARGGVLRRDQRTWRPAHVVAVVSEIGILSRGQEHEQPQAHGTRTVLVSSACLFSLVLDQYLAEDLAKEKKGPEA